MAETPPSRTDTQIPDEAMILRFRDDRLVRDADNTFEVRGSLVNLFADPQKPPLKIHEPE